MNRVWPAQAKAGDASRQSSPLPGHRCVPCFTSFSQKQIQTGRNSHCGSIIQCIFWFCGQPSPHSAPGGHWPKPGAGRRGQGPRLFSVFLDGMMGGRKRREGKEKKKRRKRRQTTARGTAEDHEVCYFMRRAGGPLRAGRAAARLRCKQAESLGLYDGRRIWVDKGCARV